MLDSILLTTFLSAGDSELISSFQFFFEVYAELFSTALEALFCAVDGNFKGGCDLFYRELFEVEEHNCFAQAG